MIKTLTISGFRGIVEEISFQLGAITLFAGRNGLGKTTVFDAIDWCLFGSSWRLGFDRESIRNIYHTNLSPIVRMEVRLPDKSLLIERTATSAFLDGSRISDRELVEALMIDPGGVAPYTRDVESRLRRVVYLSQEDVRALVNPESASERISLFQALLGVPNASVMQSGVRRISEHFRQREQETRLRLGQLRERRDELNVALKDATSETVDAARVISEVSEALNVSPSLGIDELAKRTRQELDKLSVESVQLDEAVSSIAAFQERRKGETEAAERLSENIQSRLTDEAAAALENERAIQRLASSQRTTQERNRALNAALELESKLKNQMSVRRRVEDLTLAEHEAKVALRTSQALSERLRADLDRFRSSSDLALDRRKATAVRKLELEAARDRTKALHERRREETDLVATAKSLADMIGRRTQGRDLLQEQLRKARTDLSQKRAEYDSLSKKVSNSEGVEALLRQAVSMLSADLSECPLCGTPFGSRQELLQHVARTRERYALTSDALSKALISLHAQQELVAKIERELLDQDVALAATQEQKRQCDDGIQRVRSNISTFPEQSEAPPDGYLELLDEELKSIDAELRTIKSEIDDTTVRLGAVQDEVARALRRCETVAQNLILARQNIDATISLSDAEQELKRAADSVTLATRATKEAAEAEKVAAEDQSAKQSALHSITNYLVDLKSHSVAAREKLTAETATLLAQLRGWVQGASAANAAELVQKRRAEVLDRMVLIKRLWSELAVAGTEETTKVIRMQKDAVVNELATVQRSLDQLLHAQTRFNRVANSLKETAEAEAADALKNQRAAIQECYAAMYPHGHLNEILIGNEPLGEILVTDKRLANGVEPTTYLSTGQANVLALSFFMGIALRQRLLRVGIVCLDEPVQYLDDLHFLGFVSLLKRIGLSKQVVLSTADANVTEIITRQMQSSWAELPTDFIRYDWQSFNPETGPSIATLNGAQQAVA